MSILYFDSESLQILNRSQRVDPLLHRLDSEFGSRHTRVLGGMICIETRSTLGLKDTAFIMYVE